MNFWSMVWAVVTGISLYRVAVNFGRFVAYQGQTLIYRWQHAKDIGIPDEASLGTNTRENVSSWKEGQA